MRMIEGPDIRTNDTSSKFNDNAMTEYLYHREDDNAEYITGDMDFGLVVEWYGKRVMFYADDGYVWHVTFVNEAEGIKEFDEWVSRYDAWSAAYVD